MNDICYWGCGNIGVQKLKVRLPLGDGCGSRVQGSTLGVGRGVASPSLEPHVVVWEDSHIGRRDKLA